MDPLIVSSFFMIDLLNNPLHGVLFASVLLLISGVVAWICSAVPKLCQATAQLGMIASGVVGFTAAARCLITGGTLEMRAAWQMPYGELHFGLDALSAWFLLPIFGLASVGALFGRGYLAEHEGQMRVGTSWLFYGMLSFGMAMVVLARDGLLFLFTWEVMALAPFFLVVFDHEKQSVRSAAWVYLVATHLGTAALIVMFLLLALNSGSLGFNGFTTAMPAGLTSLVFLLAVVGFGSKAGFLPMHVWLPQAHPVAPSHVSALMSGVMIKTGIYGLVRTMTFLGWPQSWWGWTLICIGILSGVYGVILALAQHDLKNLLAYSSVENIGIILLGIGVGVLGLANGSSTLAVVGFAGGLFHVLNHSVFKSLLFLGAGAVFHQTKSRQMDRLGGLQKQMPVTALTFLVGALAVSGLPPLNGFVSEFLIFIAGFCGIVENAAALSFASVLVVFGLGLISGLAIACFTSAFGSVFLGVSRSNTKAEEVGFAMRLALIILALACICLGLLGPLVLDALVMPLAEATALSATTIDMELSAVSGLLWKAIIAFGVAFALTLFFWLFRTILFTRGEVHRQPTWGCGYLAPTARMQYSASSFTQPLSRQFLAFLRTRLSTYQFTSLFADKVHFDSHTADPSDTHLFAPLFKGIVFLAGKLQWLQHGNVHLYVAYVAMTLFALLIWETT